AEGDGPVHALDRALHKALHQFFEPLRSVQLTDYKVRVLNASEGTAAKVRVLVQQTDGQESWTTVGVSENILEASYQALADGVRSPDKTGGLARVRGAGRKWVLCSRNTPR